MSLSEMLPTVGEKKKKVKKRVKKAAATGVTQIVDMSFLNEVGGDEADELERELMERKREREEAGEEGVGDSGMASLLPAPKKRGKKNSEKIFEDDENDGNSNRPTEFEVRTDLQLEDPLEDDQLQPRQRKKTKNKKIENSSSFASLLGGYDSASDKDANEITDDPTLEKKIPQNFAENNIGQQNPIPPSRVATTGFKIKKTQFTFKNREPIAEEKTATPPSATPEQLRAQEQEREDAEARAAWEKYYADMAEYQKKMQKEQDEAMGVVDVQQETLVPKRDPAPRDYSMQLGDASKAPNHIMYLAQQAASMRDQVENAADQFHAVRSKAKAQYGF